MNRIAMLLAAFLAAAPALGFADVSGPTKPGARASHQAPSAAVTAVPGFHSSWYKPALWAQARAARPASRSPEAAVAAAWRDGGVKPVLWRVPVREARRTLACAKACPCHGHAACSAHCGC